ncbi:GNAT family N-acetyltransferase [Nonomuraea angiospora]|uniref:GNAT family N-acetyltransferase n=1 Tax=Nonomuraea angiospora TaxID=46172 RepID=UPI003439BDDB
MAEIEIRELSDGYPAVRELLSLSFGFEWPDGPGDPFSRLFESRRSLAAYDGRDLVGHAGILSVEQRVPGGEVPTAGVALCAVLPTHRRRGILSGLMRRQLAGLWEAGAEPVAALTTSGAAIYGRFGYGPASRQIAVDIPRGAALPPVEGSDDVRLRYAAPETVRAVCADVHDAATAGRPGTIRYTSRWRRQLENDPSTMTPGWRSPVRCVLAERGGAVTGFAYYRAETAGDGDGAVEVDRVHATDLASYVALWRLLIGQDLMATTRHGGLAVDDPLLVLLSEAEPTAMCLSDYRIRLVDVGRGLAARTYTVPVDVVLEVRDEVCPWNGRRWRLSGDAGGATCEPTTAAPDLALDVRELGSAYLGGHSLAALARAGLVRELRKGALEPASLAMTHTVPPWRDTMF